MMQLLVLGQIPGTHIQLTYGWFQLIALPMLGLLVYKAHRLYLQNHARKHPRHFDFISLRSLDQA